MFIFAFQNQEADMPKYSNTSHCVNCCKRSPIFEFLSDEELQMIDDHRHEVVYNPGETIFKQGAACTHVLSFTSGLAKIHMEGYQGKSLIIRLIKPVEFITGAGIFVNNVHHYSVSTIDKSCVCFIEKDTFRDILSTNKKFCEEFMRLTQHTLIQTLGKLINLNQKHSKGKIAEALLYLSNEIYQSNPFTLGIQKAELAQFAGMSKEGTFKILKEFSNEKIISVDGQKIEILNMKLLSDISTKG